METKIEVAQLSVWRRENNNRQSLQKSSFHEDVLRLENLMRFFMIFVDFLPREKHYVFFNVFFLQYHVDTEYSRVSGHVFIGDHPVDPTVRCS